MAPPYSKAYNYFQWAVRQEVLNQGLPWNNSQIQRTISFLWFTQNRDPYIQAVQANPRPGILTAPALAPGALPAVPSSAAQANNAKQQFNARVAQGNANPTQATVNALNHQVATLQNQLQQARDPDRYPYPFWPEGPWEEDPNDKYWDDARGFMFSQPYYPDHPRDDQWQGVRFLGQGGYGKCGLWRLRGDDGNIIDEVVVKDVKPTETNWEHPRFWRDKRPREIKIHELVDQIDARGHQHLISHRASRVMMRNRRYRIYLPYCRRGNLDKALKDRFDFTRGHARNKQPPNLIPEGFVWYLFWALIEACTALHEGQLDGRLAGWKPITHLDIKPDNIFLKPSQNPAEPWPTPILADFSLAFYDLNNNPDYDLTDNPREYSLGNDVRYPPEAIGKVSDRIGEKADVWEIGAVLWNLITHNRGAPLRDMFDDIYDPIPVSDNEYGTDTILSGLGYEPAQSRYTEQLKALVRRCLHGDPAQRPTLRQLSDDVAQQLSDDSGPFWRDMRQNRPVLNLRT